MNPTTLIIPGLNGSGPDHWQSVWERERDDCRRVVQAHWNDPKPDAWCAQLEDAVAGVTGPVVLVAHSLGCATVVHWAAHTTLRSTRIAALLVAPCDVERPDAPPSVQRFAPLPAIALPFASVVVASRDDVYATPARSRCLADGWGSTFVDAGALGHINAASALGTWEFGQVLLDELRARVRHDGVRHRRAAALRTASFAPFGSPCADVTARPVPEVRESARP
ncbi:RBBP9/YdeN family alpha/beta hydrolase [Polymorphobacter arshaanensis]|uniref:RBBP9/YdeN family alpha/beta hydrolase n=1 Tax=Glacieibacterium arshaanense TaxID=2511025 RepID=UPI001A9CA018|nr:alpha/beta hydrolase [Polymorphobacter arshaanensis]